MNNLYLELEKRNILDRVCVLGENYIILSRIDDPCGEALLLESFSECGKMLFISREGTRTLQKFVGGRDNPPCDAPTVEEALDKGADILADIARTSPLSTPSVTGILPSFDEGAYIALGHPSAVASVTVDRLGRIYDQSRFYDRDNFPSEKIIFSPSEADTEKPRQSLLDGLYPVLFSRFSNTEYAYFIERGDLRLSPAVWVRTVRLDGERIANIIYERIGAESCNITSDNALTPERFYEALYSTVALCDDLLLSGAKISIPDKRLERSYYGTYLAQLSLFDGPEAHYGNRFYGLSGHDNFPPNYITSILSLTVSGRLELAGLYAGYLLTFVIDPLGRAIYRQGDAQVYGFSASELGQLLWVLSRYHRAACAASAVSAHKSRILAVCRYIASRVYEHPGGIFTVRTCAEADANERVADYLQNLAWSIRGIESALVILGDCDGTDGLLRLLATLRGSLDEILKKRTVDTKLGALVPFCLQYPYLPLTMSACLDTTAPISDSELREYFSQASRRGSSDYPGGRDFMENRYSNYRYYPELLSSALLSEEEERTIRSLREGYGGELLGMIRFNRWLDDWPAYNLAIHYMERGLTDKFLLLLFAHAYCHGLIDFHTYYEQVGFREGKAYARADTCAPSLIQNGLMLSLAFVYESVGGERVDLCRGVPSDWYTEEGSSAEGLCTSFGRVSVRISDTEVKIRLDGSFGEVRLFLNGHEPNGPLPEGVEAHDGYLALNLQSGEISIKIK